MVIPQQKLNPKQNLQSNATRVSASPISIQSKASNNPNMHLKQRFASLFRNAKQSPILDAQDFDASKYYTVAKAKSKGVIGAELKKDWIVEYYPNGKPKRIYSKPQSYTKYHLLKNGKKKKEKATFIQHEVIFNDDGSVAKEINRGTIKDVKKRENYYRKDYMVYDKETKTWNKDRTLATKKVYDTYKIKEKKGTKQKVYLEKDIDYNKESIKQKKKSNKDLTKEKPKVKKSIKQINFENAWSKANTVEEQQKVLDKYKQRAGVTVNGKTYYSSNAKWLNEKAPVAFTLDGKKYTTSNKEWAKEKINKYYIETASKIYNKFNDRLKEINKTLEDKKIKLLNNNPFSGLLKQKPYTELNQKTIFDNDYKYKLALDNTIENLNDKTNFITKTGKDFANSKIAKKTIESLKNGFKDSIKGLKLLRDYYMYKDSKELNKEYKKNIEIWNKENLAPSFESQNIKTTKDILNLENNPKGIKKISKDIMNAGSLRNVFVGASGIGTAGANLISQVKKSYLNSKIKIYESLGGKSEFNKLIDRNNEIWNNLKKVEQTIPKEILDDYNKNNTINKEYEKEIGKYNNLKNEYTKSENTIKNTNIKLENLSLQENIVNGLSKTAIDPRFWLLLKGNKGIEEGLVLASIVSNNFGITDNILKHGIKNQKETLEKYLNRKLTEKENKVFSHIKLKDNNKGMFSLEQTGNDWISPKDKEIVNNIEKELSKKTNLREYLNYFSEDLTRDEIAYLTKNPMETYFIAKSLQKGLGVAKGLITHQGGKIAKKLGKVYMKDGKITSKLMQSPIKKRIYEFLKDSASATDSKITQHMISSGFGLKGGYEEFKKQMQITDGDISKSLFSASLRGLVDSGIVETMLEAPNINRNIEVNSNTKKSKLVFNENNELELKSPLQKETIPLSKEQSDYFKNQIDKGNLKLNKNNELEIGKTQRKLVSKLINEMTIKGEPTKEGLSILKRMFPKASQKELDFIKETLLNKKTILGGSITQHLTDDIKLESLPSDIDLFSTSGNKDGVSYPEFEVFKIANKLNKEKLLELNKKRYELKENPKHKKELKQRGFTEDLPFQSHILNQDKRTSLLLDKTKKNKKTQEDAIELNGYKKITDDTINEDMSANEIKEIVKKLKEQGGKWYLDQDEALRYTEKELTDAGFDLNKFYGGASFEGKKKPYAKTAIEENKGWYKNYLTNEFEFGKYLYEILIKNPTNMMVHGSSAFGKKGASDVDILSLNGKAEQRAKEISKKLNKNGFDTSVINYKKTWQIVNNKDIRKQKNGKTYKKPIIEISNPYGKVKEKGTIKDGVNVETKYTSFIQQIETLNDPKKIKRWDKAHKTMNQRLIEMNKQEMKTNPDLKHKTDKKIIIEENPTIKEYLPKMEVGYMKTIQDMLPENADNYDKLRTYLNINKWEKLGIQNTQMTDGKLWLKKELTGDKPTKVEFHQDEWRKAFPLHLRPQKVKIDGNEFYIIKSKEQLIRKLWGGYDGLRTKDIQNLNEITEAINKYYKEKGHFPRIDNLVNTVYGKPIQKIINLENFGKKRFKQIVESQKLMWKDKRAMSKLPKLKNKLNDKEWKKKAFNGEIYGVPKYDKSFGTREKYFKKINELKQEITGTSNMFDDLKALEKYKGKKEPIEPIKKTDSKDTTLEKTKANIEEYKKYKKTYNKFKKYRTIKQYKGYKPYQNYKPYDNYKETPYGTYENYKPYTPYDTYENYKPYSPYKPYTPYKPYSPYKTYAPYKPYKPYKPIKKIGFPVIKIPKLKSKKKGKTAFAPLMYDEKGHSVIGKPYKTKADAINSGMKIVDNTAYNKFTTKEVSVNENVKLLKHPNFKKKSIFIKKGNTFVEKRYNRFDKKSERKGNFNIFPYIFNK